MTKQVEFVDAEVVEETNAEVEQSRGFELNFEGIEQYANAIVQAKKKLEELTNAGIMTPDVANRILGDYQYSFYNQLVKISVQ